jgi:hypothetical protein
MKNDYTLSGDGTTATIWLRRKTGDRLACLVDASDLPKLRAFDVRWYASWSKTLRGFYVLCHIRVNGKRTTVSMHRFILDAPQDLDVDHKYHDTLDNRRESLRMTTASRNAMNRKGANRNSKTGHRAISPDLSLGKFRLNVSINGKRTYIGHYSTIEQAIAARNAFPEYADIM